MQDRIVNPHTGDTVLAVGDYVESRQGAGQPKIRGEVVLIERDRVLIEVEGEPGSSPGHQRWRSARNVYLVDPQ